MQDILLVTKLESVSEVISNIILVMTSTLQLALIEASGS
jgi:hypothetical protein